MIWSLYGKQNRGPNLKKKPFLIKELKNSNKWEQNIENIWNKNTFVSQRFIYILELGFGITSENLKTFDLLHY